MMKVKYLFLFALVAILFAACSPCEKQQNLFHQNHQSYPIQVSDDMELIDFMDHMDSLYCAPRQEPLNWPILMIDNKNQRFATTNDKGLMIGIEPTPCMEVEFDLKQVLEIIKDGNNYEVEGLRTPIDSIPSLIKKHYLNYGKDSRFSRTPEGVGIWLITDSNTPMKELIPLIAIVCDGFEDVCEQYSQDKYQKSICKMSDSEYAELKELFPFHLAFKTYDKDAQIDISW